MAVTRKSKLSPGGDTFAERTMPPTPDTPAAVMRLAFATVVAESPDVARNMLALRDATVLAAAELGQRAVNGDDLAGAKVAWRQWIRAMRAALARLEAEATETATPTPEEVPHA